MTDDTLVFEAVWHGHNPGGPEYMRPMTFGDPFIDRLRLEREGWIMEDPDGFRGAPFERALHPKGKDFRYPVNHRGSGPTFDGPVVQVVYVPIGVEHRTWVESVWRTIYPAMAAWYDDDTDFRVVYCCGVLFMKSDH